MSRRSEVVEAALLLTLTRVVLAVSPRRGAAELLRRSSTLGGSVIAPSATQAERVARGVERAARFVPATTCLGRAVAGWAMLRRRGVGSVVRVGVQREASSVKMHAWLEVNGVPLIGREDASDFVPLAPSR